MFEVECKVKTYSEELEVNNMPKIYVQSHWNRNNMVYVVIQGVKYLIDAQDMIEAIKNCRNINRY